MERPRWGEGEGEGEQQVGGWVGRRGGGLGGLWRGGEGLCLAFVCVYEEMWGVGGWGWDDSNDVTHSSSTHTAPPHTNKIEAGTPHPQHQQQERTPSPALSHASNASGLSSSNPPQPIARDPLPPPTAAMAALTMQQQGQGQSQSRRRDSLLSADDDAFLDVAAGGEEGSLDGASSFMG